MPKKNNIPLDEITMKIDIASQEIEVAKSLELDTAEQEQALEELFHKLVVKTKNIDFFLDRLRVETERFIAIGKAYDTLAKESKKKAESLKNSGKRLMALFLKAGLVGKGKQYKTDTHTYFLKETQVLKKVDEDVSDDLPEHFTKREWVITPDTEKIKKALLNGETVPGYYLDTNSHVMRR